MTVGNSQVNGVGKITKGMTGGELPKQHKFAENWRNDKENWLWASIPERYRGLLKFLTFPYTVNEMTTWSGANILIRPEMWGSADAEIEWLSCIVPGNERMAFYPVDYNGTGGRTAETLDNAVIVGNFPKLMVVNDNAALGVAMSAHTIAYQQDTAEWNQSKALRSNQVGYDNARMGMETAAQNFGTTQGAQRAQNTLNNQATAVGATIGAAGSIV